MPEQKRICRLGLAGLLPFVAAAPALGQDRERDDSHHEVDEITVTATPLSRTVQQLAQPTAVLAGDELTRRQAASIGEVVADQVGVTSTYFGPVASRPVIRGQSGERVRVLANGLDTLDASGLSDDHQSGLDSILAQRIEIVRGPATLLYGSGASGGLINVVDNRIAEAPLAETVSGSVAVNGNSALGSAAGAARIAAGSGPFSWQVDGFRRSTDDVEIPGFAESALLRALEAEDGDGAGDEAADVVENSDSRTDGVAFGASIAGARGFFGASVASFDSNYGVPGHAHEEDAGAAEPEEERVRIDLEQLRVDLRGDLQLGGPIRALKFRAAGNDYRHTEFEGDDVGTLYETDGIDARLELHQQPVDGLEGSFGLQYKRIDFSAVGDEAFVPPSDTRRSSLFAFEELALSDTFALQGSLRAERQTIDTPASSLDYADTAYGASLGAVWNLAAELGLAVNLSLTERHPNSSELYADGPHVAVERFERGSVTLGAGILDKEVSTNLDVTLRGAYGAVEWTLTGFLNAADDYILLQPTADFLDGFRVFEYRQSDVDLYGAEAEALLELLDMPNGHLHARLYGDFVHAEESATGAYVARMPPLRIGAGLHFTSGALESSLQLTWHDDQDNVAANELRTAGYTLVDAEMSWVIEDRGLFMYLRASNLTDEDARQHTSPLKDTVPLPGRALQAGLRWDF